MCYKNKLGATHEHNGLPACLPACLHSPGKRQPTHRDGTGKLTRQHSVCKPWFLKACCPSLLPAFILLRLAWTDTMQRKCYSHEHINTLIVWLYQIRLWLHMGQYCLLKLAVASQIRFPGYTLPHHHPPKNVLSRRCHARGWIWDLWIANICPTPELWASYTPALVRSSIKISILFHTADALRCLHKQDRIALAPVCLHHEQPAELGPYESWYNHMHNHIKNIFLQVRQMCTSVIWRKDNFMSDLKRALYKVVEMGGGGGTNKYTPTTGNSWSIDSTSETARSFETAKFREKFFQPL